jgi:hypothetical protein
MRNFGVDVLHYKEEFRYPGFEGQYMDCKEQLWYDC